MGCSDIVPQDQGISLIDLISQSHCSELPFLVPKRALRTTEASLVRDVLCMLQGQSSKCFSWDEKSQIFCFQDGVHLSHLSQSSLKRFLHRFINASSSMRRVDAFIKRVSEASCSVGPIHLQASPTLQAFARTVALRVEHLRKVALEKELLALEDGSGTSVTLLSLTTSLSWICAAAEFLGQIVNEAIPQKYILCENGISSGDLAAHILTYLYNKMSDFCLLQDGEDEPYATLLMLFSGSVQPLMELLNSWLCEGVLDDPFGELFFYKTVHIGIDDAAFWQQGFSMRYLNLGNQMINKPERGYDDSHASISSHEHGKVSMDLPSTKVHFQSDHSVETSVQNRFACPKFLQCIAKEILSAGKSLQLLQHVHHETACDKNVTPALNVSSVSPILNGHHSSYQSSKQHKMIEESFYSSIESSLNRSLFGTLWHQWSRESHKDAQETMAISCSYSDESADWNIVSHLTDSTMWAVKTDSEILSLSQAIILPPLNDEDVYDNVMRHMKVDCVSGIDTVNAVESQGENALLKGTNYGDGSACGSLIVEHAKADFKAMEQLFPFPTTLPTFRDGWNTFCLNAAQHPNKFSTILKESLKKAELRVAPFPQILVQECLVNFIQEQVENVGKQILSQLMGEWRLMEELFILRAVYLVGSGDLLQQFSSVLFNKLDRGEPWDDFYELNTMLQESVRSSADGVLLPALDSLVVTVQTRSNNTPEQVSAPMALHFPGRNMTFGIDSLDNLFFFYKVSWPLELIIDKNAIKKYNQVMAFLFKVKRAKFALDKACRWMWKDGGGDAIHVKQQLLLQQKLMHFVNTLHQYIMDRVLYSAWKELCEGMSSARSLDEVIACHDAYLISIQRQCLVAPDKLWALISSRVKTILSLALDFYSIQRTLCGGGAAPAIKARCQLEIERIGRQFDECIVFLLRVLSFKLNVGHFPHLAELVTRINYNFYYISESGHLLTPLPEVSNKRGLQQGRLPVLSTHC